MMTWPRACRGSRSAGRLLPGHREGDREPPPGPWAALAEGEVAGTGLPSCGELPMTWTVQFSAPLPGFPVLGDSMGWGGREGSEPTPASPEHPAPIPPPAPAKPPPTPNPPWCPQPRRRCPWASSPAPPAPSPGTLPAAVPAPRFSVRGRSQLRAPRCSHRGSRIMPGAPAEAPLHQAPRCPPPPLHWAPLVPGLRQSERQGTPGISTGCSPSPWHPAGAASPGWPQCSRAGAGCRGWRRRARGGRC